MVAPTLLGKNPSALTADDIKQLIATEAPESQDLEFKAELPSNKGQDPWYLAQSEIGEKAKREILDEIVAFANSAGGWLLLGITESNDHPKRATGIRPIPKAADLSTRLQLVCRDCIEPRLVNLAVESVTIDCDGAGVIAVWIGPSRNAPHRNTLSRECCIRRLDRCERMSMREIQDLTIKSLSREATLNEAWADRELKTETFRKSFVSKIRTPEDPMANAFLVRATLIPLEPLPLGRVHQLDYKDHLDDHFRGTDERDRTHEITLIRHPYEWRPILRGTRGKFEDSNLHVWVELGNDGFIEIGQANKIRQNRIYMGWILAAACHGLAYVRKTRNFSSAGEIEFAMRLSIFTSATPTYIMASSNAAMFIEDNSVLPAGYHSLPTYSIGPDGEFSEILKILQQDIWDMFGLQNPNILHIAI